MSHECIEGGCMCPPGELHSVFCSAFSSAQIKCPVHGIKGPLGTIVKCPECAAEEERQIADLKERLELWRGYYKTRHAIKEAEMVERRVFLRRLRELGEIE